MLCAPLILRLIRLGLSYTDLNQIFYRTKLFHVANPVNATLFRPNVADYAFHINFLKILA